MKLKEKLTSPLVWGNLLAMVIVVVALIIGALAWLSSYTHHGETVAVPEVVGSQVADAEYALSNCNLYGIVADSSYEKSLPAGCVIEQSPAAGTKVKGGRDIFLTINAKNTPTRALPDIADNSSLREAQTRLMAMGFKLGPIEYVDGDKDWVYGVKCRGHQVRAGDRVPQDVPLVLQVGRNGGAGMEEDDDSLEVYDINSDGLDVYEDYEE